MTTTVILRAKKTPVLLSWFVCVVPFFFLLCTKPSIGFSISPTLPWGNSRRHASLFTSIVLGSVPISTDVTLNVARHVRPSVALVTPIGVRNMTARGSGFVIDNPLTTIKTNKNNNSTDDDEEEDFTYLLTAAHVAAPGRRIEVSFFSASSDTLDTVVSATVVGRNISLDLALIRVPKDNTKKSLKIDTENPEVGSISFCFGYPASRMQGPAMTSGIVCGIANGLGVPDDIATTNDDKNNNSGGDKPQKIRYSPQDNDVSYVVTDAAMSGGMSGGPLVSTDGTVGGVNALVRPDLRALGNYAVSATEIQSFLQSVQRDLSQQVGEGGQDGDTVSTTTTNAAPAITDYHVVLFNDPMNTRKRVAHVLGTVGKLNDTDATKVMMEAHTTGQGIIQTFSDGDEAEELCQLLRQEDVLVEVQRRIQ